MKRSKFTDSQIIEAIKRVEAGLAVPELCRELGISSATFYKWRSKYGGMDTSLMARMKELEAENARLRKMYIEETLKAEIVGEALAKKVVRPSQRREMAKRAVQQFGVSVRLACEMFRLSQACYRYEAKFKTENEAVAQWLLRLTDNHRTWWLYAVLPVPAQCEGLWLEPQARVSDLPRVGTESADQATQALGPVGPRAVSRTVKHQRSLVDGFHA